MPYATIDDFRLGMDVTKPRVAGLPGSLWRLKNGIVTRGATIERSKKFVPTYTLPTTGVVVDATGGFTITGGSAGNCISSITVGSHSLISSTIEWSTSDTATATTVAAAITAGSATHGFTASASGPAVTVTAPSGSGDLYNGVSIDIVLCDSSDITISGDPYFGDETKLLLTFDGGSDGDKTTVDQSGNGHIPTFLGNAEIDTDISKFGAGSLLLGGTTGYVTFPDSADWSFGTGEFTVEAWVYLTDNSDTDTYFIASHYEATGNQRSWQWAINAARTGMSFDWSTTGAAVDRLHGITVAGGFELKRFYHVAVTRDSSGDLRFYVDGCIQETATNDPNTMHNSNTTLHVGAQDPSNGPTVFFNGNIDSLRITKGAARYTTDECFSVPSCDFGGSNSPDCAELNDGVDADATTFGLHRLNNTLYVFGGFADPGVPSGVTYQRLAHPTAPDTTQMSKLLDSENFDGKIYAIAEYTDGSIYHFYNGSRVTAWDRVAASVSSNATVASALKDKIDLHPDFVATVATATVTIEAAAAGVANGFTISASAQNFGSINDQEITLTQVVAAADTAAAATATGSVTITGGSPNVAAQGSLDLTGGGAGSVDTVTVNGLDVLGAVVPFNTSLTQTATDVAAQITANTSTPNYTATSAGVTVTIIGTQADGADNNGFAVGGTSTTITLGNFVNMAGGVTNAVLSVSVDGVQITTNRVNDLASNSQVATDLASDINATTSTPNYTASASGNVVTVSATTSGPGPNGFNIVTAETGDITTGTTALQGGAAASGSAKEKWTALIGGTFEAADVFTITLNGEDFTVQGQASGTGETALTFKDKLYCTVSSLLFFSALGNATQWEQPAIGAGFLDIATKDEGSTDLWGAGIYQDSLALFSQDNAVIEYVDQDENLNAHLYTARSTGSRAHRTMVQYGNNDLFYLDETSGVRSLRARDSSNAPETDDVGTPIDEHLLAYIRDNMTEQEAADAVGIISEDGRYWIALKHRIYVFSFFQRAKVSAWSYLEPDIFANADITGMVRTRRKTWVRADDVIYLYGGADGQTYPAANEDIVTAQLPFMAVDKPRHYKTVNKVDIGAENTWTVYVLPNPNDETVKTAANVLTDITYPNDGVGGVNARTTHFALELECSAAGKASLYNLGIGYLLDEAK